jgi:hypothetical protein
MPMISESVEADVPLRFADQKWGEFMSRSLYRAANVELADVAWWINESDADKGVVKFARAPEKGVKVTVELQCDERLAESDEEVARLRGRLRHDLESYRAFLLQRCDEVNCRAAA